MPRKNRHQEWPTESLIDRKEILELQEILEPLFEVALSEGVIAQNYAVIDLLLPSIDEKIHQIIKSARTIRQNAANRNGRKPKWAEVTEDIIALAIQMNGRIREIRDEIRSNSWAVVAADLELCLREVRQIGHKFDLVETDSVPLAYYKAFEEVEE